MRYAYSTTYRFFYQRNYTLQNFNFYLQVLSAQYKAEEAEKALDKMQILGLQPDKETFNHLITVNAKLKNLDRVEELIEMGKLDFTNPY